MSVQHIHLDGKSYVILDRKEYDRLATLAKAPDFQPMPDLPPSDSKGNFPALEYARASMARKIIRARVDAGLNQRELARLSGVRVETLCRIETGKVAPSILSIERIDRALKQAAGRGKSKKAG